MTAQAATATTAPVDAGTVLEPQALEANNAGRLTDEQRQGFGRLDRSMQRSWLGGAAVCAVLGLLVLTSNGPAPQAWMRPIAGIAFLAAAAFCVLRSMPAGDPLSHDLGIGRVETIEGAMEKHTLNTHGSRGGTMTSYYLDIADRHFEVHSRTYAWLPDTAIVRVFYLPQSKRVVNVERLADRPVAPEALASPIETITSIASQFAHSRGGERHEAHAALEGFENAMKAQLAQAAVPPPQEQRDSRPLAEAIVGTWSSGIVSFTFGPDGVLTTALPGGRRQQGQWHVDETGRLHAGVMGEGLSGEAWIVGDVLTLASDGQGATFRRVADA